MILAMSGAILFVIIYFLAMMFVILYILYLQYGILKCIFHYILNIYKPNDSIEYYGGHFPYSTCKYCHKGIHRDSKGNWLLNQKED